MQRFSTVVVHRKDDDGDDTTFTFRVNSKLKAEFTQLCKTEHFSAAAALKRYMSHCVAKSRIVI